MFTVSPAAFAVMWALKQAGKPYKLGVEVKLDPALIGKLDAYKDQPAWDCSELVQAALFVAGVLAVGSAPIHEFDGAGNQYRLCPCKLSVEKVSTLPGGLLFMVTDRGRREGFYEGIGHVGMVIAPGYAVEAISSGVSIKRIADRPWTHGGKVRELYM